MGEGEMDKTPPDTGGEFGQASRWEREKIGKIVYMLRHLAGHMRGSGGYTEEQIADVEAKLAELGTEESPDSDPGAGLA